MKKIIILLFFFFCYSCISYAQNVKKGDTITVVKGRDLKAVKPDYFRQDDWRNTMNMYIKDDMAGNKYVVQKVKRGFIYFRSNEIKNGLTPMKFKVDIDQAVRDSVIYVHEKTN